MSIHTIRSLILGLSFVCTSLFAAPIPLPPLVVDVTGVPSYGLVGDPGNTVWTFNVGANTTITSLSWEVQLSADLPSWLSEIRLSFTDSTGNGVIISLTDGFNLPGTVTDAGMIDLTAANLDFSVGSDGILRLEFYEKFDDFIDLADAQWDAGTLTFGLAGAPTDVPEPGTLALMGVSLLLVGNRVRRRRPR